MLPGFIKTIEFLDYDFQNLLIKVTFTLLPVYNYSNCVSLDYASVVYLFLSHRGFWYLQAMWFHRSSSRALPLDTFLLASMGSCGGTEASDPQGRDKRQELATGVGGYGEKVRLD